MNPTVTFSTTIREPRPGVTGFEIPAEVIAKLGSSKRPAVKVSLNGYTYPSTVAVYDTRFLLPLSRENREAAHVEAGQTVELTLELDTAPRIVEIPSDLKAALKAANLLDVFEGKAPSHRKEWVRSVEEAKAAETRERRISKVITDLSK